jgi:hypothetical protein
VLSWIYQLNLGPVDFELDSKLVIDSLHSNNYNIAEFGEIISHVEDFTILFILILALKLLQIQLLII